MAWTVLKTGAEMFDLLHAYGLAIVLAIVGETNILVEDVGTAFRLTGSVLAANEDMPLEKIIPIPTVIELQSLAGTRRLVEYLGEKFANLDGLLSGLFTVPGVRVVSVQDLCTTFFKPTIAEDVLKKVHRTLLNWQRYIDHSVEAGSWINALLSDYEAENPAIPYPSEKRAGDISVLMTLDPAFGLSCTRPLSDGLVTKRTNLTIQGTKYAAILAMIGASRFLRTQRVNGNLVNFYVPRLQRAVIQPDIHLPSIPYRSISSNHALIAQTLHKTEIYGGSTFEFAGFAYQVMQTQGASQSISIERGSLEVGWITRLDIPDWRSLLRYWRLLFETPPEQWPFEPENLTTALVSGSSQAWANHFFDIALSCQSAQEKEENKKHNSVRIRQYYLSEVREILRHMTNKDTPLSQVMAYETGTLQFGRALRLLREQNNYAVRDILEELTAVQNTDQLLRVLATAIQECLLANAQSKFVIVPNDDDLQLLLDDIDRFGAKQMASLIIILSVIRYPLVSPQINQPRHVKKQKRPKNRRPYCGKRKTNHYLRIISKCSDCVASA